MRVLLPASAEDAVSEVNGIAALLDKNGWKAAAFIAVSVKPGTRGGSNRRSPNERLTATTFAKGINAKGWSDKIITRHFDAWEAAADAGMVPHAADLVYGERIEVPTEGWSDYYPPPTEADERYQIEDKDEIVAAAQAEGLSGSKAVDIAKNPKSLAAAIKASPKVAAAATQALVETGNIKSLSQATAAVAKNRQVERNRSRVSGGGTKAKGVNDPKPTPLDPGVKAFMSMTGLAEALRALVTTFPKEWASLTPEQQADEDFVASCEETLDKIEIAIAIARGMVSGESLDDELESLLSGGAE